MPEVGDQIDLIERPGVVVDDATARKHQLDSTPTPVVRQLFDYIDYRGLVTGKPRRLLDPCAGAGVFGMVAKEIFPTCERYAIELYATGARAAEVENLAHNYDRHLIGDCRTRVHDLIEIDLLATNPAFNIAYDLLEALMEGDGQSGPVRNGGTMPSAQMIADVEAERDDLRAKVEELTAEIAPLLNRTAEVMKAGLWARRGPEWWHPPTGATMSHEAALRAVSDGMLCVSGGSLMAWASGNVNYTPEQVTARYMGQDQARAERLHWALAVLSGRVSKALINDTARDWGRMQATNLWVKKELAALATPTVTPQGDET